MLKFDKVFLMNRFVKLMSSDYDRALSQSYCICVQLSYIYTNTCKHNYIRCTLIVV